DTNAKSIYGLADTLIFCTNPFLHVANFSKSPVTIVQGQSLGLCHDPDTWLDKARHLKPETHQQALAYATLLHMLVDTNAQQPFSTFTQASADITSKAQRNAMGLNNPEASEPLEGGPKTAEVGLDDVSTAQLLTEVCISSDLTEKQRSRLEKVITKNAGAFGLDGRLGHYDGKVDITLKPGLLPVSLPPFPASPANREVI
ncbi:hypothetical protein K435DRAFT_586615, partial [Dendrothele bispora CBS 962.96]